MSERATSEIEGLERRAEPTQKRARARIDLILSATERLLATAKVDAITTSTIAAEAGVPVSSIYRYFPNVQAIFKAMFEDVIDELHRQISEIVDDTTRWPSWRLRHFHVMRAQRALFNDNPAYRPLIHLMLSTRELRAVKDKANHMIAQALAERWRRGDDGFHGGDPYIVARAATEIFTAFESLASGDIEQSFYDKLFEEAAIALESYLSVYLAPEA